ncbi:MAG TPA: PA domain-containing protein [Bryobacteraceae bacterium]|nr:PA domain-containing protein [Bryobacteraceae bacterium]
MPSSRRRFIETAISASTLGVLGQRALLPIAAGAKTEGYRANLLPSQKEVWDWQVWMAKLGPKYTGNAAHTTYVEFLATELQKAKLDVAREHYSFPRWEARRWEIAIAPASGASFKAPVTSYFPYSGQTPASGVTGELVYAGHGPSFNLSGLQGKVALIDFSTNVRKWGEMYRPWGIYPNEAHFPAEFRPARGGVNDLTQFQKAGAVGVILAWTDISDANAADQYTPFSRPPQGIPGLYVGRDTGAKLKSLSASGAKATVVLEADTHPDTPTDTLLATLAGTTSDEVIIVNTHTDGPNATEENGGLGILALAKYFAKLPKTERKRTLVFPLTTGHFAGPWVPSMRGIIQKYPELIKKAVAALTVEHLGCKEWADDASLHYKATGENEWAVAITEYGSTGRILVDALQGSGDRQTAVVNPVHGGWLGEGGGLARAGVPTIGYIPQPNYLLAGPANGCIEKLSAERLHAEIEVFAKVIHTMDSMTAADLKAKT